jgi:predicted transcriptional regulator
MSVQETSREAYDAIQPHAGTLRGKILTSIRHEGGLTLDEVCWRDGLLHQSASARIRELAQMGEIVDSGKRRKTRSGRNAIVWKTV